MKRFLAIVAVAAFTSCGGGNSDPSNVDGGSGLSNTGAVNSADSVKRANDSAMQTGDTSALNSSMGDSTSSSGTHGQGSGSKVGGGKTGAPQDKKEKK